MKPTVRHILSVSVLAVCLVLYVAGCRVAAVNRRTVTCGDLDPIVADSLERRFVTRDDIRDWMADYGTWVGLPLDSVNLELVETIINGKSAVRDCQAWLTDNGVLHVSITQREPIVRFQSPAGGFYADAEGFLFPLQNRHTARVPVVDGALPVRLEKGFKGMPRTEAEKAWTGAILNLGKDIRWADSFALASDDSIYFTTSAVNYPVEQQPPYELYRMVWKDQKEPQNPYN